VTESADTLAHEPRPHDAVAAGTLLRVGREAAGLSVAAVAQQLKLAPRQVAAIEDGDFTKLPGRTFVRGFVRNYARLLRLDADLVLAGLPEAACAPSLESPSLAPSRRPIGELPADIQAKSNPARWAIPLALIAIVSVAAVYEYTRPQGEPPKPVTQETPAAPDVPAAPVTDNKAETAAAGITTALPNPLAAAEPKVDAVPDAAMPATDTAPPAATSADATEAADAPIALSFKGKSWVEVRDASGALVVQTTGSAGATQAVNGRAPFDVILGNAPAVTVSWHGKAFDTAPYTKQNVARFTLK
jgi:cytoskeleton protein RodZ